MSMLNQIIYLEKVERNTVAALFKISGNSSNTSALYLHVAVENDVKALKRFLSSSFSLCSHVGLLIFHPSIISHNCFGLHFGSVCMFECIYWYGEIVYDLCLSI